MLNLMIAIFRLFVQFIYDIMKFFPIKNKITMISRQSNVPNIDFLLLENQLSKKYDIVMLCKTLDGGVKAGLLQKFCYFFHMIRQIYHMATSKLVLLDTYCITVSLLNHRKSLQIIQLWHSIGTMKLFGYSAIGNGEGSSKKLAKAMRMHEKYTYVFCSALSYKDHLAKGFGCDARIIKEFPLPRVDLLSDQCYIECTKKKIYDKYPDLLNKKNIVYCPTFRKGNDDSMTHVKLLLEALPEGYNLIIKLHPLSKVNIQNKQLLFCDGFTTMDLFTVADAVISDYSCVIYEAALMNLPIYLYAYDLHDYVIARGLAINYEKEMPGLISKDASIIMKAITDEKYDFNKLARFRNKYVKETKHATKDIVDFIDGILRSNYDK